MKNIALLLLCLVILCSAKINSISEAPAVFSKTRLDSVVNAEVAKIVASEKLIGLSIGITRNGKNYVYHFGETEKGSKQKPDSRTLYPIASVTKTFTCTLLAHAILDKKVKPNDDIRQYLRGGYYPNLQFDGKPIRLVDLANHRSGIPFMLPDLPEIFNDTAMSVNEVVNKLFKNVDRKDFYNELHKITLYTVPGEKFRYSNAAFLILGDILEHVYEEPLEELIKSKIWKKMDMNRTKIALTTSDISFCAKACDNSGTNIFPQTEFLAAAGGIKSTITDMLKYIRHNIAETNLATKLTHQPFWTDPNSSFCVGLNWQIFKASNHRMIFQDGNIPGYHSYCVFYPEQNIGLVILSNSLAEKQSPLPAQFSQLAREIIKAINSSENLLP